MNISRKLKLKTTECKNKLFSRIRERAKAIDTSYSKLLKKSDTFKNVELTNIIKQQRESNKSFLKVYGK